MELVYPAYWHKSSNFGDNLAPYLIEKITGKQAVHVNNDCGFPHLALVGSLLDTPPLHNTEVWGCGFAHAKSQLYRPKEIYAVRGKLSRNRYLRNFIACPSVFGDPALLLPRYYTPNSEKRYALGIIPHVLDFPDVVWNYANKYEDVLIIDLRLPVEEVIEQIASCKETISSSLHGLIVSHAYDIPSRWVEFSSRVLGNGFKFRDYFTTVSPAQHHPEDLRAFPDVKNILITKTTIKADLDLLISTFPL